MRKARLDGSGELTLGTSRADRTHDAFRRYLSPSRDVIERCKVNGMDRVRSRIGIDVEVCTLRATVVVGRMEKISVDAGVAESEDDGVQIVPSYLVRTEMAGVTDFVIYQDMPMPGTFATTLFLLVDLGPMFIIKGAVSVPLGLHVNLIGVDVVMVIVSFLVLQIIRVPSTMEIALSHICMPSPHSY